MREEQREECPEHSDRMAIDLLVNVQKETSRSNRIKDRIIVLLIVCLFLEAVAFVSAFVWYENQFEYVETVETETEETKDIEITTEGDNANAEYNDVQGNQYNDNAVHTENGGGD